MTLEINRSVLDSTSYSIRRVICDEVLFETVLVNNQFFSLARVTTRNDGRFQIEAVEVKTGILMVEVFDFSGTSSLTKLLGFPEPLGVNP